MFSAGLTHETGDNCAFISVHSLDKQFREIRTIVFSEVTHMEKKGFYRIESLKLEKPSDSIKEALVVSAWLDLAIFTFDGKKFDHIFSYNGLHSSKPSLY